MPATLVRGGPVTEGLTVNLVERAEALAAKTLAAAIEKHSPEEWESNETLFWYLAVKQRGMPLLQLPEEYLYKVSYLLHREEQEEERNVILALANPS